MGSKKKEQKIKFTIELSIVTLDEPDTIGMKFRNTGIDLNNKDQLEKTETVAKAIAPILYAIANNIPIGKIIY